MKNLHHLRRTVITFAFAAAATAATGVAMAGQGHGNGKWQFDPARADQQISTLVSHVLENGTATQKSRLTEITSSCFNDVYPLQKQMGEGHAKISRMLLEPTIDRASLDVVRVRNAQAMEQMSRRVLQAAMDAADILTPEQRRMFNHGLHLMATHHMRGH